MPAAEHDATVAALSRSEALELTQNGGTVLCLDVPPGTEFGIDLRAYDVGPRFEGVKMVPPAPAVHLVTWGNELSCCGTFHVLHATDVVILRWDTRTEALSPMVATAEELERLTSAVRNMEHDASLAPYPLAIAEQWRGLTSHLSESVLRRARIPPGTPTEPGGIDDAELEREIERIRKRGEPLAQGPTARPAARPAEPSAGGAEDALLPRAAEFVALDPRRSGVGLSGAALSRFHLDRSEWLEKLLATEYSEGGGAAEAGLLGELQLAFVLFLRLASLRALEQWKGLLHLLCSCEAALRSRPRLYCELLPILRAQLALAPEDLFEDAQSEDNFLRQLLARLAENTLDGADLDGALAAELGRLWTFVRERFGLSVEALRAAALEDDDEPMVVACE